MQITWHASPHFHAGRLKKATHLVIHVTEGNWPGCWEWLCNPHNDGVSAHYVVSRKGEIVQLVKESDAAFHVCDANDFCIGVEHEGFSSHTDMPPEQLDASLRLVADICKRHGITASNVIGHNDPWLRQFRNNHQDPGTLINMSTYKSKLAALMSNSVSGVLSRLARFFSRRS